MLYSIKYKNCSTWGRPPAPRNLTWGRYELYNGVHVYYI